jgi:hypothetical protein
MADSIALRGAGARELKFTTVLEECLRGSASAAQVDLSWLLSNLSVELEREQNEAYADLINRRDGRGLIRSA